jgi:3-isopropylmalate/(R)-2-methylmalate dehydratase small subunit
VNTTSHQTSTASHRVWRLPDNVDTDQLAPGQAMKFGMPELAQACLGHLRPDFASGVRRGDVIVAGANFGLGSSREQAASVLVHLGVAAVIAPSFSGLYFRNGFNVGLLLLVCERAAEIQEAEAIGVDARGCRIVRADGTVLPCEPTPDFLMDMVDAGGLLPHLKQQLQSRSTP